MHAAAAKSLQLCPTVRPHRRQPTRLPHPWDSPGKNTGVGCHFLLQCRKVKVKSLSHIRLLATPWTAAYQAPPSMGFSRQEYWSGVPLPSPSYTYLTLLIFLPAVLIPACASSSLALLMIYSAYKLNKQGDNIQPYSLDVLLFLFGTSLLVHVILTVAS